MTAAAGQSIVDITNLWFRYEDGPAALCGIDLSITAGAWLALLGCNGSGKSTLVKHFNGLLRPWRGTVRLDGEDIRGRRVGELAKVVGYLPQNPDRLIFAESVRKEIAFGPERQGLHGDALRRRVDEALGALSLTDVAGIPPATLGYGLRRKVALASILALRPRLLILDEPTNGLDAGCTRHVMGVVAALQREGTAIVMITHDLALAAQHAEQVVLLQDGQVVGQGEMRRVLSDVRLLAQAGLVPLPVTQLAALLDAGILPGFPQDVLTADECAAALLRGAGDQAVEMYP